MTHTRLLVLSLACAGMILPACDSDAPATDAGADVSDVAAPTDTPVTDTPVATDASDASTQDVRDAVSADTAADVPVTDSPAVTDAPADAPADVPVTTDVPTTPDAAADVPVTTDAAADVPVATDAAADVPVTTDAAADVPVTTDAGPGTPFVATLSGAQEVPAVTTTASGTAMITLNAARTQISYTIMSTVTSVTAMHFHIGMAGENGAVAIPIAERGATITGTATVTTEQADALEQGRVYVNIHTTTNGGGEIRGQVVRPGEEVFVATLSTDQEVPPTTATTSGLGNFFVSTLGMSVRYRVRTDIAAPTAAHIHGAAAGTNGGVQFAFPTPTIATGVTTYTGMQTLTATNLVDVAAGRWYANIHTAANGGGEVRGQVLRPGERLYVTQLSGANEVPAVTTTASGAVSAIVSADLARISYTGTLTSITPTLAHFHNAAAGSNGPVVMNILAAGAINGSADTSSATGLTAAAFLSALDSGAIYVNVHTTANPGGEIRGQLTRRPRP